MARRKEDGTLAPQTKAAWEHGRMDPDATGTKLSSGGNSKSDQAFLEDEAENITKFPPGPKGKPILPDDCPWDIELRWHGHADELDPEYWEQFRRHKRQCTGISYVRDARGGYILDLDDLRLQRPCFAPPMLGGMVCQKHGGQIPQVKEAAQRRLSHAAEKAANTLIRLTDTRDEEGELVDQKVRVQAANSVLDRAGVKGGVEVEVTLPGYKAVLSKLLGDEQEA